MEAINHEKSKKTRIIAFLCAGTLAITATVSASAAQADNLEQDVLIGAHMGQTDTSVKLTYSNAQIDYVTGNLFIPVGSSLGPTSYSEDNYMLHYNSHNTEDSLFGPGFSNLFQQSVKPFGEELLPEEAVMCYTREDGKKLFMSPQTTAEGEQVWVDPAQPDYRLCKEENGYSINGMFGDQYRLFGDEGQLLCHALQQRIDYVLGLHISYKGDIITNLDVCATRPRGDHGFLEPWQVSFTDPARTRVSSARISIYTENSARFDYDTSGRLIHYGDDAQMLRFNYEGNSSRIISMIDDKGRLVDFKYALIDGMEKVDYVTVRDMRGVLIEEKQFWYGDGKTTVTDLNGEVTVYTY